MSLPASLASAFATPPVDERAWPEGFLRRLRAQVRLRELNAELLRRDSATSVLQDFCDRHGPSPGSPIVAHAETSAVKPAGAAERRDLGIGPDAPLRYRRVALVCGDLVLSRADNWYRPDRLSPEMNRMLETTDAPFGRVAAALGYRRRTLGVRPLFAPLPQDWEAQPPEANAQPMTVPPEILEHRAVLATPDGTPFSLVVETYCGVLLSLGQDAPAT